MASYADPSTTAYYDEPYGGAMRRGFLESASALAKQPSTKPVSYTHLTLPTKRIV